METRVRREHESPLNLYPRPRWNAEMMTEQTANCTTRGRKRVGGLRKIKIKLFPTLTPAEQPNKLSGKDCRRRLRDLPANPGEPEIDPETGELT